MQEPVNTGKYRKTQTIGPWHKNNPGQHNRTSEKLIEIFGKIKLTAGTHRTTIKHVFGIVNPSPGFVTLRTF